MLRVLTQSARSLPRYTSSTLHSRPFSQLTPVRLRPSVSAEAQRPRAQQQVRAVSTRKPADIIKCMGKVTAGAAALLAGSAVAVGVVIPVVVDVWARAAASMSVWTDAMIDRTQMRYYDKRRQMRQTQQARQKSLSGANDGVGSGK